MTDQLTDPNRSTGTSGGSNGRQEQKAKVQTIHPHDLAKDLHSTERYCMLDCQPVLAYDSCHITGAVHVNLAGLMKKRFVAGKIGLADLVTSDEGKEKFKLSWSGDCPIVVYDECTADTQGLGTTHSIWLVLNALEKMGKCTFLLRGGLTEFNVLHPSLCEINIPRLRKTMHYVPQRASTPGARDQALDWKTAPPVHILSFLVLGSEKDAQSKDVMKEFSVNCILNVTKKCPNYFEDQPIEYMRISVTDTGSQKLNNHFNEAFAFIERARQSQSTILIHCMAGISRSVTLTIAYLMSHFGLCMQDAYQFVKDKRPAISPNLNFMGQLVAFEKELKESSTAAKLDLEDFLPSADQEHMTAELKRRGTFSRSESLTKPNLKLSKSADSATQVSPPVPTEHGIRPFTLKMPGQRFKKGIKCAEKKANTEASTNERTSKEIPTPDSSNTSDKPTELSLRTITDVDAPKE